MIERMLPVNSHSIFDASQARVGSIAPDGDGVAAFGIAGQRLGTFATSLEAVSAIMRHSRMPAADRDTDVELAAAVARFMGVEK